jgi:hypothetical protein
MRQGRWDNKRVLNDKYKVNLKFEIENLAPKIGKGYGGRPL